MFEGNIHTMNYATRLRKRVICLEALIQYIIAWDGSYTTLVMQIKLIKAKKIKLMC